MMIPKTGGTPPERKARAMRKVNELMERVLNRMAERNLFPYYVNGSHHGIERFTENDGKIIQVAETFRMNGVGSGLENVTVTIKVYRAEMSAIYGNVPCALYPVLKVKVPKDASDKVIDRRIDQVETSING